MHFYLTKNLLNSTIYCYIININTKLFIIKKKLHFIIVLFFLIFFALFIKLLISAVQAQYLFMGQQFIFKLTVRMININNCKFSNNNIHIIQVKTTPRSSFSA